MANQLHLLPLLLLAPSLHAQWCVPTTAVPYAPTMPGITQVVCNTIDRTSVDIEDFSNSYVNTGMSTVLQKGNTYPVTIAFTIDEQISPHMNLRIWVDFNHDGQLDDVGETLLSVDHLSGPVYNGQITIPNNALTGSTRMRVTAKMCSHGFHTLPTPCDLPPDPFGYHGEIEDYDVEIVDAVGVPEVQWATGVYVFADDAVTVLHFSLVSEGEVRAEIHDASGRQLLVGTAQHMAQGEQRLALPALPDRGAYSVRLWLNGEPITVRFVR
ncbi:MAG: hypothetical protein IPK99_08540 [Flavobacteriales bacterium]|nr:hypothetical protein [Flavobacteriales bacterium]